MMSNACWLNNFNLEWVNADTNHPGKRLHKKKLKTRTLKTTGKERTFDVIKNSLEAQNNSRNRDALGVTKANKMLDGEVKATTALDSGGIYSKKIRQHTGGNEIEDEMIARLDFEQAIKEQLQSAVKKKNKK